MLSINDKIYYIDFEETGSSYTITGISEIIDNPVMEDGIYYTVHSDKLPIEMGYYTVKVERVDAKNSRFFSTSEKAKEAYKKHFRIHQAEEK